MNRHEDHLAKGIGDAELRMALRALRRDIEPAHDLWPGIAGRLAAAPRAQQAPRRRWLWPVSMAASMLLAAGLAWQARPFAVPQASQPTRVASGSSLVEREADAMTLHYQAALREFGAGSASTNWQPGFDALDRSAMEIRDALRKNPDSRLLLERLRETYARRLALSRRALYA